MTIEDLIKELKKIKERCGNLTVKVECRDSGGSYYEYDEDVQPIVKNLNAEKCVIL